MKDFEQVRQQRIEEKLELERKRLEEVERKLAEENSLRALAKATLRDAVTVGKILAGSPRAAEASLPVTTITEEPIREHYVPRGSWNVIEYLRHDRVEATRRDQAKTMASSCIRMWEVATYTSDYYGEPDFYWLYTPVYVGTSGRLAWCDQVYPEYYKNMHQVKSYLNEQSLIAPGEYNCDGPVSRMEIIRNGLADLANTYS